MRLNRPARSLLWVLYTISLAGLAIAKTGEKTDTPEQLVALAKQPNTAATDDAARAVAVGSSSSTEKIGTKDAPVDGRDGKPHAGPWVGVEADAAKKKSKGGDEDASHVPGKLSKLDESDSKGSIPEKNDGVMDDRSRQTPEVGTTGTEGGVSEKSKKLLDKEEKTGEKATKKPEAPKEAPPLPHSEETKIKGKDAADGKSKSTGDAADAKDTMDTTGKPPKSYKDRFLKDDMPYTEGTRRPPPKSGDVKAPPSTPSSTDDGLIQPLHSFVLALIMILFSEVGDKTFLVAALMAMRHDRLVVFSAAFSALIAMTVLSAVLGHAVPSLLPRRFVALAAALLFLVFGIKLLREGLAMPRDSGVGEEMKEVEAELEEKEHLALRRRDSSALSAHALEAGISTTTRGRSNTAGRMLPPPLESPTASEASSRAGSPGNQHSTTKVLGGALAGLNNLLSLVLSPAWVQTFIMTFLGEWGDRSQIATIAMAAGQDYWWVTAGAVAGHACCTGVAVVGGRALAGKVSMRVVTIGGACAFLFFGIVYFVEALYSGGAAATSSR